MSTRAPILLRPASMVPRPLAHNHAVLQRKCACGKSAGDKGKCEECEKEEHALQRRAVDVGPAVAPPIVHDVLNSPGQPLDGATRDFMERRLGHDFSKVRVHADAQAAASARAVAAAAYTVGHDVVFGEGHFAPATKSGQRLLAHELTHVLQQRHCAGVRAQRFNIGAERDEYEQQADSFADAATAGEPVPQRALPVSASGVQRLGLGYEILRFFGIEAGEFSKDDLMEYLDRITANGKCDCGLFDFLSDDKARAIVDNWGVRDEQGNYTYRLDNTYKSLSSTDIKRILIQEMLAGPTTGNDERAIITVLRRSNAEQVLEILNPAKGVSIQDLEDDIGGDNHRDLINVLEKKLPNLEAAHLKRAAEPGPKSGACTVDRALKIHYAHERAAAAVDNAVALLDMFQAQPAVFKQVGRILQCYFNVGDAKGAATVQAEFANIGKTLRQVHYTCPAEPFEEFKVTDAEGKVTTYEPDEDIAARALVQKGPNSAPEVILFPDFFDSPPGLQARDLIHEAVHHAQAGMVHFKNAPECNDLPFDSAIKNPGSFAFAAIALEHEGIKISFDDCPLGWKEKLFAATQTAQRWVNTAIARVDAALANKDPDNSQAKATNALLHRHFKIDPTIPAEVKKARDGLASIQAAFANELPFACDLSEPGGAEGGLAAKTSSLDPWGFIYLGNIVFYRHWYKNFDDRERAETVVHEMAHRFAHKGEKAYYKANFGAYMKLSQDDALDNADSFAQFTRYVQDQV